MELTKQEFHLFRSLIYQNCGLVIPDDKEYLVKQRLEPIAKAENCQSFGEFYLKLRSDVLRGCIMKVIEAITTHETSFFRDGHPYRAFADAIMPELVRKLETRKRLSGSCAKPKIRIWSAASSTGQEPYSLAMLICEHFERRMRQEISTDDFDILATDISRETLAQSMLGEYSKLDVARGLSELRKTRFFSLENDRWIIKDVLREMIEFRQFNLIDNIRSLGNFDVIFCRNVLIYFDDSTKKRILDAMSQMLDRDGYLVLGAMESTYNLTARFDMKKIGESHVYRLR
jgi:chemotaxis protein methyltransferase CheR